MTVRVISQHQGSTESRKTLEQKFIFFQSALLIVTVSTNASHSTNLFRCFSSYQAPINSVPLFLCINHTQPTITRFAPTKG